MDSKAAVILVALAVVAVVVFGPIASIWAVNALFGTAIPFTLKTWAAALVLTSIVGGNKVTRRRDS